MFLGDDVTLRVTTGTIAISETIGGAAVAGTDGGLIKEGAGTLVLSAVNSYQGGTFINGGTLSVAADNNLGASTGGLSFDGGTLRVTGFGFDSTARTMTMLGGGAGFDIDEGGHTFTAAQTLTGAGGLTKLGAGTLLLTGANDYTGGTLVSAGTLRGNTGSLQGDIVNDAAVVFDQGVAGTYAGNMDGIGGLTKLGAGTAHPDRHQQLCRRDAGLGRDAPGHHGQPSRARSPPTCTTVAVQPGDNRHLCRSAWMATASSSNPDRAR